MVEKPLEASTFGVHGMDGHRHGMNGMVESIDGHMHGKDGMVGLHGKEGWSYGDGCKIRQRPGRGRLWATVRNSCNRSQIKHVLLCFFFARTDQ